MNRIFLLLFIVFSFAMLIPLHGQQVVSGGQQNVLNKAEKEIEISGLVKGFTDNTEVTLAHGGTGAIIATALIKDERFRITTTAKDTLLAGLYIGTENANEFTVLFLEDEDIQITGEKGKVKFSEVTGGGPVNKDYKAFWVATQPYYKKREELMEQQRKLYQKEKDTTSAEFRALSKKVDEYIWKPHQYALEKLKEKPGHYWSLVSLENAMPLMEREEVAEYFQLLDEDLKKHPKGKAIEARLNADLVKVGGTAPDFELTSINGEKVSLSQFRGQYVLIDFWASSCGSCRVENRILAEIYEDFRAEGLEIVSISADNVRDNWLKASEKDGISWVNLIDSDSQQASTKYNVLLIPTSFLIDPKGIVIEKNLKGSALVDKLKSIYGSK